MARHWRSPTAASSVAARSVRATWWSACVTRASAFPPTAERPAGTPIVRVHRLEAQRGDRIGIVGPNGAGKTTLLRTIAGELAPLDGIVRLGAAVAPGYLAQVRHRSFPGATVLAALLAQVNLDNGPARSYLARFLFRGDDVFKPVAELSGGERSRLELALLGITPANLLLLDEPTNHLDIPAREALESFLRESPATLLVVSHDRRLLETICDRLWVVEAGADGAPGRAAAFDGGHRAWRAAVADGWTIAGELEVQSRRLDTGHDGRAGGRAPQPATAGAATGSAATLDTTCGHGGSDGRSQASVGRRAVGVRAHHDPRRCPRMPTVARRPPSRVT